MRPIERAAASRPAHGPIWMPTRRMAAAMLTRIPQASGRGPVGDGPRESESAASPLEEGRMFGEPVSEFLKGSESGTPEVTDALASNPPIRRVIHDIGLLESVLLTRFSHRHSSPRLGHRGPGELAATSLLASSLSTYRTCSTRRPAQARVPGKDRSTGHAAIPDDHPSRKRGRPCSRVASLARSNRDAGRPIAGSTPLIGKSGIKRKPISSSRLDLRLSIGLSFERLRSSARARSRPSRT